MFRLEHPTSVYILPPLPPGIAIVLATTAMTTPSIKKSTARALQWQAGGAAATAKETITRHSKCPGVCFAGIMRASTVFLWVKALHLMLP